jgi:hypothetical protein
LTVAIPWKSLRVDAPTIGDHLRGNIGILQSDQNGVSTNNRIYWSDPALPNVMDYQRVVCDLPSEANVYPVLWGNFYFVEPEKGMKFGHGDEDVE